MTKLTIRVPAHYQTVLTEVSNETGVAVAELVRRSLVAYFNLTPEPVVARSFKLPSGRELGVSATAMASAYSLVARGLAVSALKELRECYKLSLVDAKHIIDAIRAELSSTQQGG